MNERYDRPPPHSEEAERGLLGSAMIDPFNVMSLAINDLKLTDQSFYIPAHSHLWRVLCDMLCSGKEIDLLTVGEELKNTGKIDAIGGYGFLEKLIDDTPTAAHACYYAGFVRSKWILRDAAWIAREIQDEAYQAEDAEEFLSRIPERFLSIAEGVSNEISRPEVYQNVIDEVTASKERMLAIARGEDVGPPPYVATGLTDLDRMHGGGLRNLFYVLAGEQSSGKTTLAGQIIKHVARDCRKDECVLLFSMDADAEEHAARDMTAASKVSLPKVMAGYAKRDQLDRFAGAAEDLAKLPVIIDEESSTLAKQQAEARLRNMKGKVKLIVVDYIQLTRIGDHKIDMNANYALASIAKAYKRLARELKCPIIALSQFNNEGKGSASRFAIVRDLRGSGEISEVAHGIWLLSKDRILRDHKGTITHTGAPEEGGIRPIWIDVAKNKNGPVGKIETWMYAHYFTFEECPPGTFQAAAEKAELGGTIHPACDKADFEDDDESTQTAEEIIL